LLLNACSSQDEPHFIDDRPGLLAIDEKSHLQSYNDALLNDLDIHFKLIILDETTDDIDRTAVQLFGKLGEKTGAARGLLFLVDPKGQQTRIEVGYDLEQIFPDIFVGYLEKQQMVPFFAVGRIGAGIEATTELFVARVQRAIAGQEFDPSEEQVDLKYFSGGGGARISVEINSGPATTTDHGNIARFLPQNSPEKTLQKYRHALRLHIKDPALPLYTPQTRKFFAHWVVTDAQQNNELQKLNALSPERVRIQGKYAVIRYPLSERQHPPYFLEKGAEGWMLDFHTMSRFIQMNHQNMWRFNNTDHPFMFGFDDWYFDKNGFPAGGRK
jgi:hypothetical protein